MKTCFAFTVLLAIGVAPLKGQEQAAPAKDDSVQRELMELEQDVDRTLLREAMLLLGRRDLRPSSERPTTEQAQRRDLDDVRALEDFIQKKREAVIERSAELKKPRAKATVAAFKPAAPPVAVDRKEIVEIIGNAEQEVQLLETQAQLYRQPLEQARNAFAAADVAASNDPAEKEKAEAARKQFDQAKAKFVEISTRLQLERFRLTEMQQRIGIGGMGGGMR